ncbi:MAG: hypothetical protein WCH58_03150 [Candidatus Saccharibacteria bacterium]
MKTYEFGNQLKAKFQLIADQEKRLSEVWEKFEKAYPNWYWKFTGFFTVLLVLPFFARGMVLIAVLVIDAVVIAIISNENINMQLKKRVAVFIIFGVPFAVLVIAIWAIADFVKTAAGVFSSVSY